MQICLSQTQLLARIPVGWILGWTWLCPPASGLHLETPAHGGQARSALLWWACFHVLFYNWLDDQFNAGARAHHYVEFAHIIAVGVVDLEPRTATHHAVIINFDEDGMAQLFANRHYVTLSLCAFSLIASRMTHCRGRPSFFTSRSSKRPSSGNILIETDGCDFFVIFMLHSVLACGKRFCQG